MTPDQLESKLAHFTGSDQLYKNAHLLYTQGVKYLATHAQAFWLIDAIASYQPKLKRHLFQTWTLTNKLVFPDHQDNHWILLATNGNNNRPIAKQLIEFSDFPLPTIKLFVSNNVLMLPGEY